MQLERNKAFDLSSLYELSGAYIEITSKCNLRCLHCYNESGANNEFMTERAFRNALADFPDNDPKISITISGGEPFLHPQVWDFIDLVDQKNCGRSLIITNGTMLDDDTVDKRASKHIGIQISLNSVSSENHDRICGKGSFNKTVGALRRLVKRGLANRIHVRCMVYGHNKGELIDFLNFMKDEGISNISFASVARMGRADKNYEILKYSDAEKEIVSKQLSDVKDAFEKDGVFFDYPETNFSMGCPILFPEKDKITPLLPRIDAKGNVHLCQIMANDIYSFGNVYTDTLGNIMNGDVFLKFIWFCRFGLDFMPSCKECVWNTVCGKGCIAAILNNGCFESTDGDCYFRKKDLMSDFCKNTVPSVL